MRTLSVALLLALAGCSSQPSQQSQSGSVAGQAVAMPYARTFTVTERDGYRVIDLKGRIVSWGGGAEGTEQHARIVLVPEGVQAPTLEGALHGATLVHTPVRRIAVNELPYEAALTALGVDDRLVAVGGVFSYNDAIRERARAGKLGQVGYGWHSPPNLDALVAAKPDVMFMSMGELDHAQHMKRIAGLGIPVIPVFMGNEPDYMGRLDYVRLIGMLTAHEREADAYVAMVEKNVAAIKAKAATLPRKSLLWAWFDGGDRWMTTMRNAHAKLMEDAGATLPIREQDNHERDDSEKLGTETLLAKANGVECWMIRDDHSAPFKDVTTLGRFRAYRDGCTVALVGRAKPAANAYDFYENGPIRPDLLMADVLKTLHPDAWPGPYTYLEPDNGGILQGNMQ